MSAGQSSQLYPVCRRFSIKHVILAFGVGAIAVAFAASLLLISPPRCVSSANPAPGGIGYVLTTRSVMRIALDAGRAVLVHPLARPGRKIVHAGRHLFIQQRNTIQILDDVTLQQERTAQLPADVADIAASGSFLYAAYGRRVDAFCVLATGDVGFQGGMVRGEARVVAEL